MAYIFYFLLIITASIPNLGFAGDNGSEILLHCAGSKSLKHYEEKDEMSAIVIVNVDKKKLYLEYIEEVISASHDGKPGINSFEKTRDEYDVIDIFDGYITMEKLGSVNNSAMVMNKSFYGKLYSVDIKEDDNAIGKFDRFSGDLYIETKHYKKKDKSFEFGWAIDLRCGIKEKLF